MLDEVVLEQRLSDLEQSVADLKRRLPGPSSSLNWLEKITGSISDESAFLEALAYGRAFREADRPAEEPGDQP